MSQVLIGVGGSGQHIVLAYLRMLALGNATAKQLPHVFLIDADAQLNQAPDRKSQLVPDIAELHNRLKYTGNIKNAQVVSFRILRPYNTSNPLAVGSVQVKGILVGANNQTPPEVQALFNDDDLSVMLSEGMHANPKVGSTIFGEKLATCLDAALQLTVHHPHVKKQFEDLFAEHVTGQQAQPLRVVIVGSVFGGTGSGIVPTLARNLSGVLGNGPTIATVTTLPWFTLRVGADGQTGSASDERKLKRNTSFAIRNFHAQLAASTVASVFIQSGPDWPLIERPSAGDSDQPEHPHLINLIAASAVQRLFEQNVFQPNHLYAPFALTHDEQIGRFSPLFSPHLQFSHSGQTQPVQLWQLLVNSELTAYVLHSMAELLETYQQGKFKHLLIGEDAPQYVSMLTLLDELRKFKKMDNDSVKSWGGLRNTTFVPVNVAQELAKQLKATASQIRDSLVWFDKHHEQNKVGVIADFITYRFSAHTTVDEKKRIWNHLTKSSDQTKLANNEIAESRALKVFVDLLDKQTTSHKTFFEEQANAPLSNGDKSIDQKFTEVLCQSLYQLIDKSYAKPISEFQQLSAPPQYLGAAPAILSKLNLPLNQLNQPLLPHYGTFAWDAQLVGAAAQLDNVDINHPQTLYWLDPYRNTTVYPNNVIDSVHVKEAGVQGVPNLLACFLLQQWRFKDFTPANVVTELQRIDPVPQRNIFFKQGGHGQNEFQSTKLGLYLHAQRVVEAALWLLVSNSPEVVFEYFSFSNPTTPYQTWLKQELLRQGWSDTIGVIRTTDQRRTPLFLWNGLYWCLAANNHAEQYFAAMLNQRQLPSLRARYTDLFIRDQHPRATSALDMFFAAQLTKLLQKANIMSSQSDENSEKFNPLCTTLTGILSDLPAPTPNMLAAPVSELNPPLWLDSMRRDEYFVRGFGSSNQLSQIKQFLLPNNTPFVFADQDPKAGATAQVITQFLPVSKEYWLAGGVVNNTDAQQQNKMQVQLLPQQTGNAAFCEVSHLDLFVPGMGFHRFARPFSDQKKVLLCSYDLYFGLSIWPKFKADGWNLYHVSFEVTKGDSIEYFFSYLQQQGLPSNFSVTVYDETLTKNETFNLVSIPVKINFAPAVLELACGGVVIGTRPINLAQAPAPSGTTDIDAIGLDFGTTNSCMAYEIQSQRKNINLANTMDEPASIEMMLSRLKQDDAEFEFHSNAGGFYLQRQASIAPQYALTMPSELLLSLSLSTKHGEMDAQQISILQNQRASQRPPQLNKVDVIAPIFTPLPSEFYGYDQNTTSSLTLIRSFLEKSGMQRIYGDIKWPRQGDNQGFNISAALRTAYLEQIISAAFARLRAQGKANIDYFAITRPDAFDLDNNGFASTYSTDVATVLQKICTETGMKLNHADPVVVSETAAARHMAQVNPAESFVVIDMGGGTTDIAIHLCCKNPLDEQPSIRKLQLTSSIKWAGNALLSALIARDNSELRLYLMSQLDGLAEGDNKDQILSALLKKLIRANVPIMQQIGGKPQQVVVVVKMFFEAMYEYILVKVKLLLEQAGFDSVQAVGSQLKFILQGNGFRLSDYFSHPTNPIPPLNGQHLLPQIWDVVFANDPQHKQVTLNVRYQQNSKEEMISIGAMDVARMQHIMDMQLAGGQHAVTGVKRNPPETAPANVLVPPQILDVNSANQPQLIPYTDIQTMAIPKIAVEQAQLLAKLQELHPYTKKYWPQDKSQITFAFSGNPFGSKLLYDLGAFYLLGDGSQGNWCFLKEMQKRA